MKITNFKRNLQLSSASVMILASGMATFSSEAMAQRGGVLRPASNWSVTQANGQDEAYCTMAQRFEYNTILTIAQNQSADYTLAVDFQRPVLKSGKALNVVLDPGAGQQREFVVESIANQAFVAKIGHDPIFFDALNQTGFLRVSVGAQTYNFDLSKIETGRLNLEGCVSRLAPPMQRAPIVASAPPVTGVGTEGYDDGAGYAAEIASLRAKVGDMERQNEDLAARVNDAAGHQQPLQPLPKVTPSITAAPVKVEKVVNVAEVNNLSALVAQLRGENNQLSHQLDMARRTASSESQKDAQDFKALEVKNMQLHQELEAVYAQQRDRLAQNAVQTSAREQVLLKDNQEQAQKIVLLGQQSVELEALRSQNQALLNEKKHLEMTLSERAGDSEIVSELRTQISVLGAENNELVGTLAALRAEVNGDGTEIAFLQTENKKLKAALKTAQLEMDGLKVRIASGDNTETLQKYAAQLAQKEDVIVGLTTENTVLRGRLSKVAEADVVREPAVAVDAAADIVAGAGGVAQDSAAQVAPIVASSVSGISRLEPVDVNGLTLAQQQELSMKRALGEQVAALPIPPEADLLPPEMPLEVRRSEDPLEGFESVEAAEVEAEVEVPVYVSNATELYAPALPASKLISIVAPGVSTQLLEKASGPDKVVYQWGGNEMYGSAEQKPIDASAEFDTMVQAYLEKTEGRCPGDFAIVPDGSIEQSGVRVDSYDVACVGPDVNSSAALVFFNKDGTFSAFAQEAPSSRLAEAIDGREKIVNALISGS